MVFADRPCRIMICRCTCRRISRLIIRLFTVSVVWFVGGVSRRLGPLIQEAAFRHGPFRWDRHWRRNWSSTASFALPDRNAIQRTDASISQGFQRRTTDRTSGRLRHHPPAWRHRNDSSMAVTERRFLYGILASVRNAPPCICAKNRACGRIGLPKRIEKHSACDGMPLMYKY